MNTEQRRDLKALQTRLRKIEDTPEDKRERRFDMYEWLGVDDSIELSINQFFTVDLATGVCKPKPGRTFCGSAACALGEAALMPRLQAKGLKLVPYKGGTFGGVPKFKGKQGVEAGEKFFGITHEQANYLFTPNHDGNAPGDVANRIEAVLDGSYQ